MGLAVRGRLGNQRSAGNEHRPERLHDRARQLVLDREDALQLPVVALRPEVIAALAVDQLRSNAQGIPFATHAALQDGGDAELLADLPYTEVLALVGKGRRPRDDANAVDVRQRVDQLLGHAVGEVLVVAPAAQVGKGEHGDRRRARHGSTAVVAPREIRGQAGEQTDRDQHQ